MNLKQRARYNEFRKKKAPMDDIGAGSDSMSMPEQILKKYAYGGDVQASDIEKYKESPWFQNPDEMDEDSLTAYEPDSDVPGMGDHDEEADPYFAGGIVARRNPQSSPSKSRDARGLAGAHDEHGDDLGVGVDGNERDFAQALRKRKIRGNRG